MSSENYLHILSTSRAIREKKAFYIKQNSFLPKMLTVFDFESKAITLGNSILIDNMQRVLYLKEATNFSNFRLIKKDLNLVKFYTNAEDFFRFFEEVSAEGVKIEELYLADMYAEFDKDLELLAKSLENYRELLKQHSLNDKIFIPTEYKLNESFINSFDGFVLELEGYLTKFELELFSEIAKLKPFLIHLKTTPFNQKIVDSFRDLNIDLPDNSVVKFDLNSKKIIETKIEPISIDCEVIEVGEHLEQIAVAFAKIEEFVCSGINPENIALIVPDESIVPAIRAFDRLNNLNFAMGRSYREYKSYKFLEQINKFLSGDDIAKEFLTHNKFDVKKLPSSSLMKVEEFFTTLKELELPLYRSEDLLKALDKLNLLQTFYDFNRAFKDREFDFKSWLFLWLNEIKEHSIDDTNGGKVTVMGLLESRGISFEAVVIIDFNDGIVPAISNKDRFLNSAVRANAKLPTKSDRENLQKHYYARVLERAKTSAVIYSSSDNMQPSKFLYELGLGENISRYKTPLNLMFNIDSSYKTDAHLNDVEVEFNARATTWSAHKLKTFLECRRKFYYRYIKKIEQARDDEINEGRILHDIISKVITPKSKFVSVEELEKALMIEIDSYSKDNAELLYKKPLWSNILDGFVKNQIEHFKKGYEVVGCEFSLNGEIAGLKFIGRVDRMDSKDGFNLVIDYKSGSIAKSNAKDSEKIDDFQMSVYSKLLDKPAGSIDFMFIEILNGGKESYLEKPEEKETKLLEHIEYLKSIKSFKAERCEDLQKCRYCPYQLLCHRGEYL